MNKVIVGDCIDEMKILPEGSVDSVVTDPPYGLGFMGKGWDIHTPLDFERFTEAWATECLRVLKPGGHLLAFGGSRTWHRLAVGIEDAGFELRDSIAWLYGSGFPKSMDVSKAIDATIVHGGSHSTHIRATNESRPGEGRMGGPKPINGIMSERKAEAHVTRDQAQTPEGGQWSGWGTALKPAFEPIVVARKPLGEKTVATNVLKYGTGALNIDATRIGTASGLQRPERRGKGETGGWAGYEQAPGRYGTPDGAGRWPANVVLDESQAAALDEQTGMLKTGGNVRTRNADTSRDAYSTFNGQPDMKPTRPGDSGGASRFFYVAKAPKSERPIVDGVAHPTVKPLALMRWLIRLVTPPGGMVLDPFAGSGTTIEAAIMDGFDVTVIENEVSYIPLINARIARSMHGAG